MTGKKIWLVGNTGLLGQAIEKALIASNIPYVATHSTTDIGNLPVVLDFIKRHPINTIINCAAYSHVDLAETKPDLAYYINAEGAKNLALASNQLNSRLIHFSSDYVFDGNKNFAYTEDDLPNPLNVYGKSKLLGDNYIKNMAKNYLIIRTSWLYGRGHCFINTMLTLFNQQKSINIINDQYGNPTCSTNLAKVVVSLLSYPSINGLYNYSSEGVTSWYDLACYSYHHAKALNLAPADVKLIAISSKQYGAQALRPAYSSLNKDKIKQALDRSIDDWKISLKHYLLGLK